MIGLQSEPGEGNSEMFAKFWRTQVTMATAAAFWKILHSSAGSSRHLSLSFINFLAFAKHRVTYILLIKAYQSGEGLFCSFSKRKEIEIYRLGLYLIKPTAIINRKQPLF